MNSAVSPVRPDVPSSPSQSENVASAFRLVRDGRMQHLLDRRECLGREGRRSNFVDNPEFLVYHWSGTGEGFAPPTGEQAISERINIGDNSCRVYLGTPFPDAAEMPSRVNGLENDVLNWARDYAFFLDHNPCEIHPEERHVRRVTVHHVPFDVHDGHAIGLAERRPGDQGAVRLDELVDGAAGHLQGLGRRARHDLQGLVESHRRGQGPAGAEERLQRAVLLVEPAEQVGVVNGDRREHRDLREELSLVVGESPARSRFDQAQHADDAAVELQRRIEGGLLAPAIHLMGFGRRQIGVVAVDLDDLAVPYGRQKTRAHVGVKGLAGRLLADLVVRLADPGPVAAVEFEVPEGEIREKIVVGVVAVDVAGVDAERLADLARSISAAGPRIPAISSTPWPSKS